jgi:hypothetical protein
MGLALRRDGLQKWRYENMLESFNQKRLSSTKLNRLRLRKCCTLKVHPLSPSSPETLLSISLTSVISSFPKASSPSTSPISPHAFNLAKEQC